MLRIVNLVLFASILILTQPALATHPAQFSPQISAMLKDSGLYPSLGIELDYLFNRNTLRTTQRKLQQVRLARKHGVSEIADTARKTFFAGRRRMIESRWLLDDAIDAGDDEAVAAAVASIKEKVSELEELKTNFLETVKQWTDLEKQWSLMTRNDFANFVEAAFFKIVRRNIYEPSNKEDPRLVPKLVDDLNYFIAEAKKTLDQIKYKLREV